MTKDRLIILDRDGVINRDLGRYVESVDELEIFPDALLAIALLKKHHYKVAIATNQAGIAKGKYSDEQLAGIHAHLLKDINAHGGDIDQILYCPSANDQHAWRKPNPGMLLEILKFFSEVQKPVYFVGDTLKDAKAAIASKIQPVIVQSGKPLSQTDLVELDNQQVPLFKNLYSFVHQQLRIN